MKRNWILFTWVFVLIGRSIFSFPNLPICQKDISETIPPYSVSNLLSIPESKSLEPYFSFSGTEDSSSDLLVDLINYYKKKDSISISTFSILGGSNLSLAELLTVSFQKSSDFRLEKMELLGRQELISVLLDEKPILARLISFPEYEKTNLFTPQTSKPNGAIPILIYGFDKATDSFEIYIPKLGKTASAKSASISSNWLIRTISGAYVVYPITNYSPLHPPANLKVSNGFYSDRIILEWEKMDSAIGYAIYRKRKEEKKLKKIALTHKNYFTDLGIVNSQIYEYAITSITENKESVFSNPVLGFTNPSSFELPPPFGIVAISSSTNKIRLNWEKVQGADGYKIFRFDSKLKSFRSIGTTTDLQFEDKNAKDTQYYRIAARKKNLESDPSRVITGNPFDPNRDFKSNQSLKFLSLKEPEPNKIELEWSPLLNSSSVEYSVFRKEPGEKWELVQSTTQSKIFLKGFPAETFYLFQVRSGEISSPSISYVYSNPVPDKIKSRSFSEFSLLDEFFGKWSAMLWDERDVRQIKLDIRKAKDSDYELIFNNKVTYKGNYIPDSPILEFEGKYRIELSKGRDSLNVQIRDKAISKDTLRLPFLKD